MCRGPLPRPLVLRGSIVVRSQRICQHLLAHEPAAHGTESQFALGDAGNRRSTVCILLHLVAWRDQRVQNERSARKARHFEGALRVARVDCPIQEDSEMADAPSYSGVANAAEFEQPHWRTIAQGFDTEKWFNDGLAVGTGGIAMPQPTRLPSGQYYYRFANSTSQRSSQLGGGWWIDFEAFKTVEQFASGNGYRLKDAARLMLALPYDWTKVDVLVKALLRLPLRAYTGLGKPAQGKASGPDRGTKWIPTQHVQVRQIYIPGLFVTGRSQQLYETVFVQPPAFTQLR